MEWKLIGTSIGEYNFSEYNELLIIVECNPGTSYNNAISILIPILYLTDSYKNFRSGFYYHNNFFAMVIVTINLTKITEVTYTHNGSSINSTLKIYAR